MPVLTRFATLLDQARRALLLVWGTSRGLFLGLVLATLVAGVLPALAAWLGQRIVDAVVTAMQLQAQQGSAPLWPVVRYVLFEAGVLALLSGTQRALSVQQSLLRVQLGQKVNTMILEKAQTLSLVQFENSEFYDKLVRVRREASTRPLALVMKSLGGWGVAGVLCRSAFFRGCLSPVHAPGAGESAAELHRDAALP
ncbi:ABC-type multidrug transport system fused ATPase/permease subunit [Pseudomonas frederiksbergensis]